MPVQVARRPLSSDWLLEDEDSGISSVSQRTHVDARFCSNSAYSYWLVLAQAEKTDAEIQAGEFFRLRVPV